MTTTAPPAAPVDVTTRLVELATIHDQLTTAAATIRERLAAVTDEVRTLTGEGFAQVLPDGHKIVVRRQGKFSPRRAESVLTPDKYAACHEIIPARREFSTQLAKEVLTGAEYAACQEPEKTTRVEISIPEVKS